jgi:energy-coupling factor transporter ATP-binding protein EcfA2
VATETDKGLPASLNRLADGLAALDLRGVGTVDDGIPALRDRLVATIRSYLLPRLEQPDAPMLVVLAGPTGSGKSTLINSLTGLDISPVGVLRPTTSTPSVLAADSNHAERVTGAAIAADLRIGHAPILGHMTFVDTPDIDSTAVHHRAIAEALVDIADVVVFVTSGIRYADGVPWEVLRRALSRGATVIPVLNRVGAGSVGIVTDYAQKLGAAGLPDRPIRIAEHHLEADAPRIPVMAVRELKRRLFKVANARRDHRIEVSERVLSATVRQVAELADRIEAANDELAATADRMRTGLREFDMSDLGTAIDFEPGPKRGLRRSRQDRAQLARVQDRLVAELESRLRRDVADHGALLLASGHRLADLTRGSGQMLRDAVAAWIDDLARQSTGSVESVIGEVASSLKAGPDDFHTGELSSRLQPIWSRFGARMASAWLADRAAVESSDVLAWLGEVDAYLPADA